MNNKGVLYVFSGPSGSGKGTILAEVFKQRENLTYSISATTRKPREGEVDGVNYYFISKDEFETLIKEGKMLEYTSYCDNYYGTPATAVSNALKEGKDVILEIEVEGAMQIKKKCPDCVTMFILPPSMEVLENRLRRRQTEDEATILKRLSEAKKEVDMASQYDYNVVNGELEVAVEDVCAIFRSERLKTKNK